MAMAALRLILGILSLGARAHPALVPAAVTDAAMPTVKANDVTLELEPVLSGGYRAILKNFHHDGDTFVVGHIGMTVMPPHVIETIDDGVKVYVGNTNLTVRTLHDASVNARAIKIEWIAGPGLRMQDCIDFGSSRWYAGPMQVDQLYPLERASQAYRPSYSQEPDNGAIMERYWLNSAGGYVFVHSETPLFFDYGNMKSNHLCFGAQLATPYSSKRDRVVLAYDLWFLPNVKEAHKHAIANYLGKPTATPDFTMVQHPIWSTWAQYSRDIDGEKVLEFAEQIKAFGFNNSQLEIDDQWETCYGSLNVNTEKFPNLTKTVQDLKELGYRVTIWVHPFINRNCEPWYSEALNKNYLVLTEEGSPNTTWWNSNGTDAGYIDFTNRDAAAWYTQRLQTLLNTYNIDSFKFDAGEASFAPEVAALTGDIEIQPHLLVQAYAKTCAQFGDMVEVRAGFRTQSLPIYTRMVDRDSIWGINNGLATVLTTTFQMNLNGYPFVLPDMIGGNGYNLDHDQADLPTKELFIRWVQANTFLPVMQYSFAPWNFDEETVAISKQYTELHAEHSDVIYKAMQAAVRDGTPVNAPLWWIDPTDAETFAIWDEYLLGETVLVAPVLTEGARSRDIYIPVGTWYERGNKSLPIEGPTWLRSYPAPLDVLPYFVRDVKNTPDSGVTLYNSAVLVLLGLIVNVVINLL